MEDKNQNQIQNKMKKIKIRNFKQKEQITEEFKEIYSKTELQLSIKFCEQPNIQIKLFSEQICKFTNLLSLSIKIDQVYIFNINELLIAFKPIQTLESLALRILTSSFTHQEQSLSIGDYLKDLSNLKSLHLKINCKELPNQSQFLRLESTYQKLDGLRNLYLNLYEVNDNSIIIQSVFEGLGHQINLNSLTVKLQFNDHKDKGLLIFSEELKSLTNLQNFKFSDYNQYYIIKNTSFFICRNLKYLENLESLYISVPINLFPQLCYLEGIQNFKKLKYIGFYLKQCTDFNILGKYLDIISQSPTLENVNLHLNIEEPDSNDDLYLQLITKQLNNIPNVTELELELPYNNSFTSLDFMWFFQNLKHSVNLKKIVISNFYQNRDNTFVIDIVQEEIQKKFQNLKVISLDICECCEDTQQENYSLPGIFWINMLDSFSSLQQISFYNYYSSYLIQVPQQTLLSSLILNKQDIQIMKLYFGKYYQLDEIDLKSFFNQIKQHLNLRIFYLEFLNELTVSQNLLISSLSDVLYSMINLNELNLTFGKNNNFEFQQLQRFCQELKSLKQLKYLSLKLKKIQLSNKDIDMLLEPIQDMQELKILYLDFHLTDTDSQYSSLENRKFYDFPPKLKRIAIIFKHPNLQFSDIKSLIFGLKNLKNLRDLNLKAHLCKLQKEELEEIQGILQNLVSIKQLFINFNQTILIHLSKLFEDLKFLENLNLNYKYDEQLFIIQLKRYSQKFQKAFNEGSNQIENVEQEVKFNHRYKIENDDIINLAEFFKNSKVSKVQIQLNSLNQLDDDQGSYLFSTFQYLKDAKDLNLIITQNTNIGDRSFNQFGLIMKNLINLSTLSIDLGSICNNISFQRVNEFQTGLKQLKNLQNVKIKVSFLSIEDLNALLQSLSRIIKLKSLSLIIKNQFDFEDQIFDFNSLSFQNLIELQLLINSNQIGQYNFVKFYNNLKFLEKLTILKIINNEILLKQAKKINRLVKLN